MGGQRGGQLVGRLTGAGLGLGPGGVDRLGRGVGLLAHPDRGLGAALGLGPGRLRRGGALLGRGAGRLDLVLGGAGVGHRGRGVGQPLAEPGQPVGQGAHLAEHLGPADPGHGDRLVGVRHGRGVLAGGLRGEPAPLPPRGGRVVPRIRAEPRGPSRAVARRLGRVLASGVLAGHGLGRFGGHRPSRAGAGSGHDSTSIN